MVLLKSIFITFLILMIEAKKFDEKEKVIDETEEFLEFKRAKDRLKIAWLLDPDEDENSDSINNYKNEKKRSEDPPPVEDVVLMARYIVNQVDWTSVATISTRKDILTYPTVNVVSFSDGPIDHGSGVPYLYITPLDFTAKDLAKDNRATLIMTLAEGNYCKTNNLDPMDPRCARVILTGKIKPIKNDSHEMEIAKSAVFGRHPALKNMPADHHFFFVKLKIKSIAVLDTFGGPKYVNVKDYFHPSLSNITEKFYMRFHRHYAIDSEGEYSMKPRNNFLNPSVYNV